VLAMKTKLIRHIYKFPIFGYSVQSTTN